MHAPPYATAAGFGTRHIVQQAGWLLLRPELATVADLAAHVAARFRLHRSCPGGRPRLV